MHSLQPLVTKHQSFSATCVSIVHVLQMLMPRQVWNCNLHYEVHTFTGHMKAVTGTIIMYVQCSTLLTNYYKRISLTHTYYNYEDHLTY